MLSQKVSIGDKLLKLLTQPKYKYKGMPVSALGIPTIFLGVKMQSVRNAVLRLEKKNFIEKNDGFLKIKMTAQKYIERRMSRLTIFENDALKKKKKNLLILFDIPESRKSEREWLRLHLKSFGYEMIQKSIWFGPSPLPKEFLQYIHSIKLEKCIKAIQFSAGKIIDL